jgi:ABC-type branched-subunit amino acid transport system substrate-binding protein
MLRPWSLNITAFAGMVLVGCLLPLSGAAQLTPAQAAGKQIYNEGTSPSGRPLEAILGEGSTRVPATLMLCASCHGFDGKGRPEGGITPSIITWDALTTALRSANAMGHRRPAYNLLSLRRAITHGVDPLGKGLGVAMPRYQMSPRDLNNLIEYLKVLGKEFEPGLTATSIRLGTIVAAEGPFAISGQHSVALLKAYFDELNQQGGIYGRRLELLVMQASGTPQEITRQAEDFVRKSNLFAMVGILVPGAETRLADLMERLGVPTVGAFASNSEADAAGRSKSFYLLSGLSQQARVLVKFAGDHARDLADKVAVVYPESMADLAGLVMEQCRTVSMADVTPLKYSKFEAARFAGSLAGQNVRTVFFLGRGNELAEMLAGAPGLHWSPTVYQPGPLAGEDVLKIANAFDDHVFLSFPTLPTDLEPDAVGAYNALVEKHNLGHAQPARSLAILASAKVLLEGLRRSGRQLGREKFITTLAAMYGFQTGLTPPISFGATKRIGALGAYVVKLDLKNKTFVPVESWVSP